VILLESSLVVDNKGQIDIDFQRCFICVVLFTTRDPLFCSSTGSRIQNLIR
jgi:hypothetical protein